MAVWRLFCWLNCDSLEAWAEPYLTLICDFVYTGCGCGGIGALSDLRPLAVRLSLPACRLFYRFRTLDDPGADERGICVWDMCCLAGALRVVLRPSDDWLYCFARLCPLAYCSSISFLWFSRSIACSCCLRVRTCGSRSTVSVPIVPWPVEGAGFSVIKFDASGGLSCLKRRDASISLECASKFTDV